MRFRTLEEAGAVSTLLAQYFPDPKNIAQGLLELTINAIEHGNLGITYEEKSQLLLDGKWQEEVKRRLALPENQSKYATIEYSSCPDAHILTIRDEGSGFDWQPYLTLSEERNLAPNGRGIAIARMGAFPSLEYTGNGNTVVCRVNKYLA